MADRSIKVGILGFGTVGSGTYRMLHDNRGAIEQKVGMPIEVVRIGIKDAGKDRGLNADLFTTDLQSIVDDPNIDVVLELIGGTDPAGDLVVRAINNGKNVVGTSMALVGAPRA